MFDHTSGEDIVFQPKTNSNSKSFWLPAFAIKDNLLSVTSLPDFYVLFALYIRFAEKNKGKTRLVNTIKITEIGKLTGRDTYAGETRESIQIGIKRLREKGIINYTWIPSRCAKDKELVACKTIEQVRCKYCDEIREVKENNHHAAIVFEFTRPPIVEKIEVNERKRLKQLERHKENNSIPLSIPSNLCTTVKGIVQKTKASRSALSLYKLALWAITVANIEKIPGTDKITVDLETLNCIIGYKSQSKGKTYNIELLSGMLEQLTISGVIKGYKKRKTINPTFFIFPWVSRHINSPVENKPCLTYLNLNKKRAEVENDDFVVDKLSTIFSFTNFQWVWIEDASNFYDVTIYTNELNEHHEPLMYRFHLADLETMIEFVFSPKEYTGTLLKMRGDGRVSKRQHKYVTDFLFTQDNRFVYDDPILGTGHLLERRKST